MKCSKCGHELKENDKFCTECGEVVNKEEVKEEKETKKEDVKTEKVQTEEKRIISSMGNDTFYCVLSMICFFGGPIISGLIAYLSKGVANQLEALIGILPLAGLALCIYAKIKYPQSKFAKVLLIVYIVLIVLAIIAIVVALIACVLACRSCADSWGSMGNIFNSLWLLIK